MAKSIIGTGSTANDGTGDTLRAAGGKINDNFSEIYTALGDGTTLAVATVATTGAYSDLSGAPTIPADLSDLTDTSTLLFSGAYNDLSGAPTIPADLSDLTDTTTLLFDGAYSSLSGAPTIPANLSDLTDATSAALTVDQVYLPAITRLDVTNNGTAAYRFDQYGVTDNATIYAISGTTIAFNLNIVGHPFLVQTSGGTNYDTGLVHVSNTGTVLTGSAAQGQVAGTLYWKIPASTTGNYQYQCSVHGVMVGVITIKDISAI